jgi:hypothetical protein
MIIIVEHIGRHVVAGRRETEGEERKKKQRMPGPVRK